MLRLFTKLSIAITVASLSLVACGGDPLKRVTVEMTLRKGAIGQENSASLHFHKGAVDCSLNFYSDQTIEHVESLGSNVVPVAFDVSYSSSGKPTGASLVKVGDWNPNKLQPNERLLATSQSVELSKPGEPKTFKIDSPAACFDTLPASQALPFSSGTAVFYLLLVVNVALLAVGFLHRERQSSIEHPLKRSTRLGTVAVTLACSSQILFLAYAAAGRWAWVRFYPGNPVQTYSILIGIILSGVALVTALFGSGFKRIAGALVAVTTAGLWVLAAIASVAV